MSVIDPDIFKFLKDLSKNNNREWFNARKDRYKFLHVSLSEFSQSLNDRIGKFDNIDNSKIFRIYRDVRFSKNKTPYKTNFGISFHRKKPYLRGGYYIHLKPKESFIACGFWNPNKDDLYRIRKEFQVDSSEFRKIIRNQSFENEWGSLKGNELKTAPMGFSKDDPNIDLIKKKMYLFSIEFTDNEVLRKNFSDKIIKSFKAISPFFDYMSNVLTTDLNGESNLNI